MTPAGTALMLGAPFVAAATGAGFDAITSPAVHAILRERIEQVERHGYAPDHDDSHDEAEIGRGALAYLVAGLRDELGGEAAETLDLASAAWPWGNDLFRPADYPTALIKAGAMIVAELDRIIRTRALLELGR